MQRISVTTLEKFRRYITEASPFDTEESLLESLKGLFTGNDKTKFGSAYHKVVEGEFNVTKQGLVVIADNESFVIPLEIAKPGLDYKKAHPLMVHEMKLSKIYESNYFPIQVSGRVDGMEGACIRDLKCKFRSPDWQEYMDSLQWKCYLDIMELSVFYYDIFEIKGFAELPSRQPYLIDKVQVIAHEPLMCEKYDYMNRDIMYWLNAFLDYVHQKNLLHLLKPAIVQDDTLTF